MKNKRLIVLTFFSLLLLGFAMGNWGLTESSEARYAEISREMYNSGDYLNPRLLGISHYHKPPVTYYITAAGYFIFGRNEFGARFFLLVALVLQVVLVYHITRLLFKNLSIAINASLLYLSYPLAMIAAKNLTTDCYLTTFIFAGIWFFLKYKEGLKPIFIYLFYLSSAAAFLTKGPVGIMPSALFVIGYSFYNKPVQKMRGHHWVALTVGLLIACSWFVILFVRNEKLVQYFFGHQIVDRVASNNFGRTKPFWYYFAFMPLLGLPAIIIFFHYVWALLTKKVRLTRITKPLLFTLLISLLVFSFSSSKLVLYVLPLYLFIALLSALHLNGLSAGVRNKFVNISTGFALIIFGGTIVAAFVQHKFIIPILPALLVGFAGIAVMFMLRKKAGKEQYWLAPMIGATTMVLVSLLLPFVMKANEIKINSVKPMAQFINALPAAKGNNVMLYNYLLPSLAFYTHKNIITVNNGNNSTNRETQFENEQPDSTYAYIKLSDSSGMARLRTIAQLNNFCIVVKKSSLLPDSLRYLMANLKDSADFDKWIIYY